MAEGKKGFILYADIIHTVKKLPIEKRGELFTIILEYVNDLNPEVTDLLIDLVWEPIKRQMKRDLEHWESIKVKRSEAGKLGGRPRKQTEAKKPNALFDKQKKQSKAKKAVIVNDTVNANDTVTVNDKESEINRSTHPALIGFRKNVLVEAKEQGINDTIAESFFDYWTVIDEHTKLFLYQATEPFGIKNRLKNWKAIEDKNNSTFKKVTSEDFEL